MKRGKNNLLEHLEGPTALVPPGKGTRSIGTHPRATMCPAAEQGGRRRAGLTAASAARGRAARTAPSPCSAT